MPEYIWELPPETAADEEETVESTELEVIDHEEAAVRRLVVQFQKPKFQALVRALCRPMQQLEQALVDLSKRTIDNAEGVQIDIFGRLVGQPPVDVEEADFKSLIRARISANKSSGLGKQITTVSRLVVKEWAADENVLAEGTLKLRIRRYYPAGYVLVVEDADMPWDLATLLAQFLREITGSGIRSLLHFSTWMTGDGYDSHERAFQFSSSDEDHTLNGDGLGFGHVEATALGLIKTGGSEDPPMWDAGASSVLFVSGDCSMSATAPDEDASKAFGMSNVDTDQDFTTIDYCVRLGDLASAYELNIYELGVLKFSDFYVPGDVFRIRRISGAVDYLQNEVSIYTSLTPSIGALCLDTSFFHFGGTLTELKISGTPVNAWNLTNVSTITEATEIDEDIGGKLAAAIE